MIVWLLPAFPSCLNGTIVWSVVSFVLLLAGIGGMVWYFGSQEHRPTNESMPRRDPLLGLHPTPSQKATVKYFFVVAARVVQVAFGGDRGSLRS